MIPKAIGTFCAVFLLAAPAIADDEPPGRPENLGRLLATVPRCQHRHYASPRRAPAARSPSMPEFFMTMGQRMAVDPARGMQSMIDELSKMDEPAMRDIRLSPAEERRIGKATLDEFLQKAAVAGYQVNRTEREVKYFEDLVETIARLMKNRDRYPEIEITLIDAPVADAYCLPGGYLVFTTGLLAEPDEATVISVVAHELAHLDLGHVYEYAKRSKLAETTFASNPADFNQFFTRGMALMGLMMNPYRPEHESEADCVATSWLYVAGYDPMALVGFFERLHDRLNDQPAGNAPQFFAFARSHPFSLDRRREVLRRLDALRRWRPRADLGLYPDNLRSRTARLRAEAAGQENP